MKGKSNDINLVFEGALSLTIATIIVKMLGAVYKIPISHVLGEEGMGYFNSAYTVYSFFYLLCTAGVPKAIMILCASEENKEGHKREVVKTAFSFFGILGFILTAFFILFSHALSNLIGSPNAANSMIAIAPSIVFAAISGVARGYFSAEAKFIHVAISQIIEGAGKLIFGLILAHISSNIFIEKSAIAAFAILGATIGCICSTIYLLIKDKTKNISKNTRQNINLINKITIIKSIAKISLPITISAITMSISNIIDLGIVMNRLRALGYTDTAATALYGNYTTLATPMFNMIISLFTPITIAFMTKLIKEKHNKPEFSNTLKDEISISYQLFVPLTVGLCVYSEETLSLLFEDSGVYIGSVLLVYLLLSIFLLIPLSIINCALEALGDEKIPMISIIVGSIFKVISAYLMIGNPKYGICGAPISTLISYAVAFIISLLYIQIKRGISLPILKSLGFPLINSFISILGIYPIYLFISRNANPTISFIFTVIITIIIYIFLNILNGNLKELKKLKKPKERITT